MQNHIEAAEIILRETFDRVVAKGWTRSQLTVRLTHSLVTPMRVEGATITLSLFDDEGNVVSPERDCLYFHAVESHEDLPALRSRCAENIERTPTVKEHFNSELFSAVQKAADLAQNLNLSADFINPILALAEQLRTNIIEAKPSPDAE